MIRPDRERAAAMAYRVLAEARVQHLPVDPLTLLRRCRETKVYTYEEAADALGIPQDAFVRRFSDSDAFTFCTEGKNGSSYITVYRADGNPARQRFTLAHELGHRVLCHQGQSTAEEQEADCFASHLLCPRPVLTMMKERFGDIRPEQAAAVFYVSLACANRLDEHLPENISGDTLEKVRAKLSGAIPKQLPLPIRK